MSELVIFDLDNTLVKGQSQMALLRYAKKRGLISLLSYCKIIAWFILYKLDLVKDPRPIMEYSFNFLKGKTVEDLRMIIRDFFQKELRKRFFKESLRILKEHKDKGRKVVIISNAIEYIPEEAALFLGANHFIGTKLEISSGKFTGKIQGKILYGKNKVPALNVFLEENRFFLNGSWGYSDHHSDIFLLEMVEFPVAVNPTKKLLQEAKKQGWPTLSLKETLN